MENRYDKELLEFKSILEATLFGISKSMDTKLVKLVAVMKDFIGLFEAKEEAEKKIEHLKCKLRAEKTPCCGNECEDCKCKEDKYDE